jgi:hypothetical protein
MSEPQVDLDAPPGLSDLEFVRRRVEHNRPLHLEMHNRGEAWPATLNTFKPNGMQGARPRALFDTHHVVGMHNGQDPSVVIADVRFPARNEHEAAEAPYPVAFRWVAEDSQFVYERGVCWLRVLRP